MSKGSGGTRSVAPGSSVMDRLKNSNDWFINAGMERYDDEKASGRWDFSDMANLSEEERTYVVAYLSNAYRPVNRTLRGIESNSDAELLATKVSSSIKKLDVYTGIVYRGEDFTYGTSSRREAQQNYQQRLAELRASVGKTITEKSFVSAGEKQSQISKKFNKTQNLSISYTIESKTGRDLRRYNSEEKEVLFDKGSKFKVLSVRGNKVRLQQV